jgi:RNase adapter protein RapZ
LEFDVELLYLDASDETIISRFSETRRKHPLSSSDQPLAAAISQERVLMENLSALADLRLDTSNSLVHQFRSLITDRVARRPAGTLSLQFCSFGYKNGVPADADFVFDLRCLPNPYWDPALRGLTGRDSDIQNFFHAHPMVDTMINDIIGFFDKWIAVFESENRSYLTVALGCTGGRHRSVFVAERIADHFKNGRRMMLIHRDS